MPFIKQPYRFVYHRFGENSLIPPLPLPSVQNSIRQSQFAINHMVSIFFSFEYNEIPMYCVEAGSISHTSFGYIFSMSHTNAEFAEFCLQSTATLHLFPNRDKLCVKFYSTSKQQSNPYYDLLNPPSINLLLTYTLSHSILI